MKFIVSEDKKFLRLSEATELELEQLKFSFTKRIRGWFFNPLVKKKLWDGKVPFFKNNLIPVGLWNRVYQFADAFQFQCEIEGLDRIIDKNFDEADFRKWANDFFADHPKYKARDYQVDSAIAILKYRISSSQIATSAGKTLISFLVYGYLKSKGKCNKILVIVPNTTLVIQLKEDWEEYNNGKLPLKIRQVYGGSRDNDLNVDVIVGTFHSLVKKTVDFYKGVDLVNVDEAHQTKTTSIKTVLSKCHDSIYRFGLSGTMQEDESADFFTIESLLGPVVNHISPKYLFKEGHATPVKFKMIVLSYNNPELREKLYLVRKSKQMEGSQLLAMEKNLVVQSRARFNFIVNLVKKTGKNTLVLFSNIKDQYGKNLYEAVKDTSDKECFYIDGGTAQDHRDFYKKEMEKGENRVLFASFTTFSTGISIKNLHNIVFVESYKSEIIIKQSIGRGMRQLGGKESFTVVDIVDDLSWEKKDNFLYRHAKERLEFYKQYTSDISVHRVNL